MSLISITAPAISENGLKKLRAFCTPQRLTRDSTNFDMGYEQAKRDFLAKLDTLVGKPEPQGYSPRDPRR